MQRKEIKALGGEPGEYISGISHRKQGTSEGAWGTEFSSLNLPKGKRKPFKKMGLARLHTQCQSNIKPADSLVS